MIKNVLKRLLSTTLALLLVATTFFIFDPSGIFTTAQAAVASTNPSYGSDLYFVVPEAIYLNPVYNAYTASTSSTFQYYVNNKLNGTTITPETGETTLGKIFFYYANTSSVRISFKWQSTPGMDAGGTGTITFGDSTARLPGAYYTTGSSASQSIPISAGTCPALTSSTTGMYIQWIAEYTDSADGLTKQAYAYTYVYKPYVYPIGTAQHSKNTRGSNHFGHDLAWISGVHGVDVPRTCYPCVNTSNGFLPFSSSAGASSGVTPQLPSYFRTTADNESVEHWVTTDTTAAPDRSCTYMSSTEESHSSGNTCIVNFTYSATGRLTVDSSRYSNLNQIPNLTVGLMVTSDEGSSSGGACFVSNRTEHTPAYTTDYTDYWRTSTSEAYKYWDTYYNDDKIEAFGTYNNWVASESEGVKINTRWSRSITSSEGTSTYYLGAGYANHESSSDVILNVSELRCNIIMYNKSALRTAYITAIKSMPKNNPALLKSAKWTEFFSLFNAVAKELCRVDGAFTSVTVNGTGYTTAAALATALTDCVNSVSTFNTTNRDVFTATQKHIKVYDNSGWKYNGSIGDKSVSGWYKGATVSYTTETPAGYTYKGFTSTAPGTSTIGTATSVQSGNVTSGNYSHKATGTETIYYYYLRDNYTITFDANGGTAVSSKAYHVESTDTLPSCTGKTGYSFSKWKVTTAGGNWTSGATYNPGTALAGKYGNVTLQAQWTEATYVVTLDRQGGTSGTTSVTVTYNAVMPDIILPTRTGYTFGGYYDGIGGSGTLYYKADGSSVRAWNKSSSATLYANWMVTAYTISYNLNGGALASGVSNPTSYTIETNTITLNNPSRTGYTFSGWTGSNGSTPSSTVTIPSGSTGDRSYAAMWTPISYTISYALNGGSFAGGVTNPTSYTIETNTFTLNNPTKNGYTFMGWTGSNGNTAQTNVTIAKGTTGNLSFTANWTANAYTLMFEPNGGAAKSALTYKPTDTVTLGSTTRTGYNFVNWKVTTASGNWTANSTYDATMSVNGKYGNATLAAQWSLETYTITYSLDGGSVATANPTSYNVTTATFTLNNPSKTGYTFAGWTGTGLSGASTTVTVASGSTGDRVYTATWNTISYTISYDLRGGSVSTANPTSYTITTATFTLSNPSRKGYTFAGWTGSNGTTPQTTVQIVKGSIGNKSYTANWTANTYTVTLDQQSGTGGSTSVTAVYDSAMPSATMPQRNGYDFAGYFGSAGGQGTKYYNANGASARSWDVAGAGTLYAYWAVRTYTITYDLNGGSVVTANPTSYTIAGNDITLNNPIHTGYSFEGWTGTDLTQATKSVTIPAGSIGNRSYTANWTAIRYTISYILNGGSLAGSQTNPTEYTIETTTFTLNNPTKTGCTFTGWTGSNGTTPQTSVTIAKGSTGDRNYNANFTANTFILAFNPNGGSVAAGNGFTAFSGTTTQSKNITYGDIYGKKDANNKTWPTAPIKTGYTFAGWKNGGDVFTSTMTVSVTRDVTVTAEWTLDTYTISYNLDGGAMPSGKTNPTKYYYTSDAITLNNPYKTGYTFAGWTGTDLPQAMTTVMITPGSTGNRVYTATWDKITYSISYDLSGGELAVGVSNPTSYTITTPTFTLINPYKTGYTFAGWTGTGLSAATVTVSVTTGSTGDKSYTAIWTANMYRVTLDAQGGSGGSEYVNATYDRIMPAATMPTKEGYTFGGYFTAANGQGEQFYNAAGSGSIWRIPMDTTLYALWTPQAHVHQYSAVVTPATCTTDGFTTYTCEGCGDVYVDNIVHAFGHDYESAVTAPTCTQQGYTTYTCKHDPTHVYTDDYTAALGHDFGEWVITKEPTLTEKGERTRTCSRCPETETEAIDKLQPPAPGSGTLALSDASAHQGETFTVTVSILDNPGIISAMLHIEYDAQVLTLLSVENSGLLGTDSFHTGNELTAVPFTFFWVNSLVSQNITEDGVLATLTFRAADDAPEGVTPITITYSLDSTLDKDLNEMSFILQNGAVSITDRLPGDANADGTVNLKDVIMIERFLAGWNVTIDESNADVDESHTVTLADVVLIERFLVGGWSVVLK